MCIRDRSGIVAGTFSVGIFVFGASGVFSQLFDTFNSIWHVDGRKQGFWFGIQKRCIGILMVLLVGLMLIGALVLNSMQAYATELLEGNPVLLYWLNYADRGVSFLLMPIVFSLLFWFIPATNLHLSDVVPAGFLTAMLVLGSRSFIQLYLRFSSTSEVYGAAGSVVVMLIWIYMISMVLFYGASFSHAWSLTFGSRSADNLATSETQAPPTSELSGVVPERRNANSTPKLSRRKPS